MRSPANKLLALLLALLMGWLPLSAVQAAPGQTMPMATAMAQGADHGATPSEAMAQHHCDDCTAGGCCDQGRCDLGHCGACLFSVLPPAMALSWPLSTAVRLTHPVGGTPAALPDPLYRPPRA